MTEQVSRWTSPTVAARFPAGMVSPRVELNRLWKSEKTPRTRKLSRPPWSSQHGYKASGNSSMSTKVKWFSVINHRSNPSEWIFLPSQAKINTSFRVPRLVGFKLSRAYIYANCTQTYWSLLYLLNQARSRAMDFATPLKTSTTAVGWRNQVSLKKLHPLKKRCTNLIDNLTASAGVGKDVTKSSCPVSGTYIGKIPDDLNLCSVLKSSCESDVMHFQIGPCESDDILYEKRTYQCLGQWRDDQTTYTFTKRLDVVNTFECFVGLMAGSEDKIILREAGSNCFKKLDPSKYGMQLDKTGEIETKASGKRGTWHGFFSLVH